MRREKQEANRPNSLNFKEGFLLEPGVKVWSSMKNEIFGDTRKDLPRSTDVNYKERQGFVFEQQDVVLISILLIKKQMI